MMYGLEKSHRSIVAMKLPNNAVRLRREWSEGAWPRGILGYSSASRALYRARASLCWVWVRLAELRVNVDAAAFQLACRLYSR